MTLNELLITATSDTQVTIDNISLHGDIAIVDFGVKDMKSSSFSIPVKSVQFLERLSRDISSKPKVVLKDKDSKYNVTEKDYTEKLVDSSPAIKCKKHPNYSSGRKPKRSEKNPNGCETCWTIYRTQGK